MDRLKRGRGLILCLAAVMLLSGCGKHARQEGNTAGETVQQETSVGSAAADPDSKKFVLVQADEEDEKWLYESETIELEPAPNEYFTIKQIGEKLYYLSGNSLENSQRICRYSTADKKTEQLPIALEGYITKFDIGEDGSAIMIVQHFDEGAAGYYLDKYDADGRQVYSVDLAEWTDEAHSAENGFVSDVAADSEGRVCLAFEKKIIFFDEKGEPAGNTDPLSGAYSRVSSLVRLKDGGIVANIASDQGKSAMAKVDFAKQTSDIVLEDLPPANCRLSSGKEQDILSSDSSMTFACDLTSRTGKKLFDWADIGINGNQIRSVGEVADGKYLAVSYDWSENKGEILLLTRVAADGKPQKEEIVLASPDAVTVMQNAVAEFNRKSDKYHITIKKYIEGAWTQDAAEEAATRLSMELAAGNGPDLIDMSFYNTNAFAKQGYLEDLMPYLEQSTVVRPEDFVDNVLAACTVDGKLTSLPKQFNLMNIVGYASNVGKDAGWTVEEFMQAVEKHPDKQVLMYSGKDHLLWFCLQLSLGAYMDTENGTCSFDSPEFIRLLEFANRYGDNMAPDNGASIQEQLQKGEILLMENYMSEFTTIQQYQDIFKGDPCIVGYPTTDGRAVCMMLPNVDCGMAVNSAHKEGAWAFLESYVTGKTSRDMYAFAAVRERLEEQLQEEMNRTDGLIVSYGGASGYTITYHTVTKEEADLVMELISIAEPWPSNNSDISKIINEETADIFEGSKPAAEVARVIQNRVQLYLNENR